MARKLIGSTFVSLDGVIDGVIDDPQVWGPPYWDAAHNRVLIEHGLLDELHLWVFPVIVGSGARLMDGAPTTHLDLLRTHTMTSGIVVHVLGPKAA
jgi:hypothetical protein